MKHIISTLIFSGMLALCTRPVTAQYEQKNLVADRKGHAIHTDPNLINGWGRAFFPHGPFGFRMKALVCLLSMGDMAD
jgi:hypothetical protein